MRNKTLISIIIIGFIATITFHFTALAVTDAPHNESNNINCGSCHGIGLLNSPFWGGTMSYDQLCLNCHNASSGPYSDINDYSFFRSGTDTIGDGKYNLSEIDVYSNF
jgi:hypothetical protein